MSLFSAALGLAGSVYGANKQAKAQAAAMAQQQYEFERNRELQNAQMALALDDRRLQREENAYNRAIERINRRMTGDERRYQMSEFESYQDRLLEERRDIIERQIIEDKEAARRAQFELEQYLQNRDLAQEERETALAALREAQAVAAGERDEDKRRLLEDRARRDLERQFVVEQYQRAQDTFARERQDQEDFRNLLMSRIDSAQQGAMQFAAAMGMPPEVDYIDQGDFDAEYDARAEEYLSDVDRAAERVISTSEAGMNRRGMLDSTQARDSRAELTRRLAPEYTKARRAAYDDAMKYIGGRQGIMRTDRLDDQTRRANLINEMTGLQGMAISPLLQLPSAVSSTGQYNLLSSIPSGVYDRALVSANDYQAPIGIGTGIYDNMRIGSQLGGFINPTSAASLGFMNIGSGIYNPLAQAINAPNFTGINNLSNNMLNAAQTNYANAAQASQLAGQGVADAFAKFGDEFGAYGSSNNWWNIFGAKPDDTPTGDG